MRKEQHNDRVHFYDDNDVLISDGDEVRVNESYIGTVRIMDDILAVEAWPPDDAIESIKLTGQSTLNIDTIHPTMKE